MTEKQAKIRGKALLKCMHGKGWKLRVWENFGWHYSVYNETILVYGSSNEYDNGEYRVLLSADSNHPYGGDLLWTPHPAIRNKDPNKAVRDQLEYATKAVNKLASAINATKQRLYGVENEI